MFIFAWLLMVVFLALFDLQIFFPFHIGSPEFIPYHRWQSVRLATFMTVAYLIIKYMLSSKPFSTLAVLEVYLIFLLIIGCILFLKANVELTEWVILGFFFILLLLVQREKRGKLRKHFVRR
jgi:hypothetical protein